MRGVEAHISHLKRVHAARVQKIEGAHDAAGQEKVRPYRQLEVLRKPELGIEVVEASEWRGPSITRGLVRRVEREGWHGIAFTFHGERPGAGPGVDLTKPLVGGRTREETHAAPHPGRAPAGEIVVHAEPGRPEDVPAGSERCVNAKLVQGYQVPRRRRGEKRYVDAETGRQGQPWGRCPLILSVDADLVHPERDLGAGDGGVPEIPRGFALCQRVQAVERPDALPDVHHIIDQVDQLAVEFRR